VLFGNALDALSNTPTPRISVSSRLASEREAEMADSVGPILAIDVLDNGPGVPAAIEKELFRVVQSGKPQGVGFGLSFCRHVATSAGGNVYYNTGGRGGAEFTLLFPYKDASEHD
jgi:two-component system, NtrC family, nitrogen regulation sensor histidine kinase GlnL